tara:strand:- start:83 stop:694 length:612 start_codon:yes stop_codon:yes gene_type:complete
MGTTDPKAERKLGIIFSAGPASRNVNPEDLGLPDSVTLQIISWTRPDPEFAPRQLLAVAEEMEVAGIEAIAMVGSSRGVGPAQSAVAIGPDDMFLGGYVAISGAALAGLDRDPWNYTTFLNSVQPPVFQMYGDNDLRGIEKKMLKVGGHLSKMEHPITTIEYEGTHGFLARNETAQRTLKEYLLWTLLHRAAPEHQPDWWIAL